MPLFEATHPLVAHKMTLLRDQKTSSQDFRKVLRELTFYLGYEATRSVQTAPHEVTTPMGMPYHGGKISEKIAIIPILRAGLGMSDAMLDLLPRASVHHMGMYRAKASLLPVQYYNRLPKNETCDVAYICDPCIATSNTIHAVCSIVRKWAPKARIVVVAAIGARVGVDKLLATHPDVDVFIGAIDETLSPEGMILPGIGDAGDRQFGTPSDEVPHVGDVENGKRKRDEDN
jgi:uracil phosphoribosyltransferase